MFLEWENNSGKFQNNAISDVKQISLRHVIKLWTVSPEAKTQLQFWQKKTKIENKIVFDLIFFFKIAFMFKLLVILFIIITKVAWENDKVVTFVFFWLLVIKSNFQKI